MASYSVNDLEYLFYGGGSDAAYTFLKAAYDAGVTANSLLALASGGTGQPLDADLTAIAALTTTTYGRAFLALANAAAARTAIGTVIGTDVEAHDADLTTIAAISPSNDDVIQRKAGAWSNRTLAQLWADLLTVSDPTRFYPRWTVGAYYTPTGPVTATAVTLNNLYASPISVPIGSGIDRLISEATTSVALSTVRMFVAADDGNGMPGAVLYQSASIDSSTAGVYTDSTIALTNLRDGQYWVGLANQGAASTWRSSSPSSNVGSSAYVTNQSSVRFRTGVTGAIPDPVATTTTNLLGPRVVVRAS